MRPLPEPSYTREFPIGSGSLARILNHTLIGEWYYVLRMRRDEVPPIEEIIRRERHPPAFDELERLWAGQAGRTREAIATMADWQGAVRYSATDDETGRVRHIRTTPADIFTQLVLHEVHHRAQVLNILRQLGVETEDIDYNLLRYQITEG